MHEQTVHRRSASQRGLDNYRFPRPPSSPMLSPIPASPNPSRPPSPPASPPYITSVPLKSSSSPTTFFFDALQPTKAKPAQRRTTFVAFFGLVALCVYVFFIAPPRIDMAPIALQRVSRPAHAHAPARGSGPPNEAIASAWRLATWKNVDWKKVKADADAEQVRPQVRLDEAQEFGAVASFLAALPENHIPSYVDPDLPIDPSLVLDFDTRSAWANEEVEEVVRDVWLRNPVMLFSKVHSSTSREVKSMLSDLHLKPGATVIDVDQRADAAVLEPLLLRLTQSHELPVLVVGGHPVGSMEVIRRLNEDGTLRKMVAGAGAAPDGARRKGGRH